MDGTWIHALLDLIVLGILAALILSRHLELKREQQRLLDTLFAPPHKKRQQKEARHATECPPGTSSASFA